MANKIEVLAGVEVTPAIVAQLFWGLDDTEQAEFFAALDDLAGISLCFQMAAAVNKIVERADAGDRRAQNGFQTMLSHAQAYVESATDLRVWRAQRELRDAIARIKEAA